MRKVWNRPAYPVWSLLTFDRNGKANMNICTYVMSTSMTPKQMTVAVYRGTKTLLNLIENPTQSVVLQLLAEDQAPLVRLLGQQSGQSVDKLARLEKRDLVTTTTTFPYLTDVLGIIVLENLTCSDTGGDHLLYTGTVTQNKNFREAPTLTTTYLREHKYTR